MPSFELITRFAVSLLPVLLFLVTLVYLDSYKLVHIRTLVLAIFVGCGVALLSLLLNDRVIDTLGLQRTTVTRYIAPVIEELLKAVWVAWLIGRKRLGFLVDAAIVGFAVGTGFALIENTYYIQTLHTKAIIIWMIRGLGTAVMHGGMTALYGIVTKSLYDRFGAKPAVFLPGLLLAFSMHSFYNHFILPPVVATVVLHATLPGILLFAFWQSERSTRRWLGTQMDVDAELLEILNSGGIGESRIGHYVETLKQQFSPEVLVDMLCYLRIHVELAISAKGLLMMREAGFKASPPDDIREQFVELRHLEKSIGPTGRLAIGPFLHQSTRDLWQIYMLDQ
ncbi:MAG TPA: PrsW family glutamic-type intramembrane protease [Candidatus Krumholzibacteria bacterium]|nr:PrsW family glutamic-type intramembrane protease [Candidatus Krumholzibacteria bacterium]